MENSKQNKSIIVIESIIVMILWGLLFPLIKKSYSFSEIDTSFVPNLLLFAGVRFSICGVVLSVICKCKKQFSIPKEKKLLLFLFLVSLFAVILHYSCTYIGLSLVDSGKTALLKQLGVLIFLCSSSLFFKEDQVTWQKIVAGIIGIGAIIILNTNSMEFQFGFGELLILIASFCTVFANVFSKKVFLFNCSPFCMAGISQLFGGIVLIVVGVSLGGTIGVLTLKSILLMTLIVIVSCVSYSLWYINIARAKLSSLFIIKFLEPLFAQVFSMLIFQSTTISLELIIAFVLTIIAILISNLTFKKA